MTIKKPEIISALSLPRYAVGVAHDVEVEVGDELFVVMDGSDANFYYENDNAPSFAGRAIGAEDTHCIGMLCSGGNKPRMKVVRVSDITATVDVEQILD